MKLVEFSKTGCGVDFLMKAGQTQALKGNISDIASFKSDFFELFFFNKGNGKMWLNGKEITISDNLLLFISPYQQQRWEVNEKELDFKFVIFQEDFLNEFLADKYFVYRLLYCYQSDNPPYLLLNDAQMAHATGLIEEMETEQAHPVADSYHMLVSCLYRLLLKLNRLYAEAYKLPFGMPKNNYAYRFKLLLEQHIGENLSVTDYADQIGISRICLNKSVKEQFGVTASEMLRKRLLAEVKNRLLFSGLSVKEVAYCLHFSETNHLMRFFKQQTGQTVCDFIRSYQMGSNP